jgi:hypothetical protein
MLRTIVPCAVSYEIKGTKVEGGMSGSRAVDRSTIRDSFMFSDTRVGQLAEISEAAGGSSVIEEEEELQSEKIRKGEPTNPLRQLR